VGPVVTEVQERATGALLNIRRRADEVKKRGAEFEETMFKAYGEGAAEYGQVLSLGLDIASVENQGRLDGSVAREGVVRVTGLQALTPQRLQEILSAAYHAGWQPLVKPTDVSGTVEVTHYLRTPRA
jgi:hypothetical protein